MKTHDSIKLALITIIVTSLMPAAYAATEVVGGQTVSSGSLIATRTVGIFMGIKVKKQVEEAICSGEILDNSHILTAAHCATGVSGGYVVFSTGDITTAAQQTPGLVRKITAMKQMPGYAGQTGGGGEFPDFSIVTFAGGVPDGFAAANFLPESVIKAKLKTGTSLTLAGYGITSPPSQDPGAGWQGAGTLRKVGVKLAQIGSQGIDMYLQGSDGHIACEGDSGGPAMVTAGGQTYVVGVDSRGNCTNEAIYSIVTKEMVSSFLDSASM